MLGIPTPDFVIPNNFIPTGAGVVSFAGVYTVVLKANELPTDGVNALYTTNGIAKNVATNFAGESASVTGTAPPPASANYQGLWYKSPAESESGWDSNALLACAGDEWMRACVGMEHVRSTRFGRHGGSGTSRVRGGIGTSAVDRCG